MVKTFQASRKCAIFSLHLLSLTFFAACRTQPKHLQLTVPKPDSTQGFEVAKHWSLSRRDRDQCFATAKP